MSILIEFVTAHFLYDRHVSPPDDDTRSRTLAQAAKDFFANDATRDSAYISLDLFHSNGVMLKASIENFDPGLHDVACYTEEERHMNWGWKISRTDLNETIVVLDEIESSLRNDALNPLICCRYSVD